MRFDPFGIRRRRLLRKREQIARVDDYLDFLDAYVSEGQLSQREADRMIAEYDIDAQVLAKQQSIGRIRERKI